MLLFGVTVNTKGRSEIGAIEQSRSQSSIMFVMDIMAGRALHHAGKQWQFLYSHSSVSGGGHKADDSATGKGISNDKLVIIEERNRMVVAQVVRAVSEIGGPADISSAWMVGIGVKRYSTVVTGKTELG